MIRSLQAEAESEEVDSEDGMGVGAADGGMVLGGSGNGGLVT